MISTTERNEFVRKIESWRCLNAEEQDIVISDALTRCEMNPNRRRTEHRIRWLMGAASNVKKEVGRAKKQRERTRSAIIEIHAIDRRQNGYPLGLPRRPTQCVESLDCHSEQEQICREVLNSLSPLDRQIIDLCVMQGLQPAEAGRILSLSRSTTKSRRDRLLLRLKKNTMLQKLISSNRRSSQ